MSKLTKIFLILAIALLLIGCAAGDGVIGSSANATAKAKGLLSPSAQCMEVSLTGTLGGPGVGGNLAGAGTLVKFGTNANNCGDIHLQFDTGRATSMRLAQLGVNVNQLDAVFITHLHSDHTVGLVDIAQTRWHFFGKSFDLVCSGDHSTPGPNSRTMSCRDFGANITCLRRYL